jgi:hypothetical protein
MQSSILGLSSWVFFMQFLSLKTTSFFSEEDMPQIWQNSGGTADDWTVGSGLFNFFNLLYSV